MKPGDWIRKHAADPAARRWLVAGLGVSVLHVVMLLALAPAGRSPRVATEAPRPVAPIYIELTPQARPPRPVADEPTGRAEPSSPDETPILVRPSRPSSAPPTVAPLQVEIAPPQLRSRAPGRVIPHSWRERCGLGDGEVSEEVWLACRDGFIQAATPTSPPVRGRGDPANSFAAQGAARLRRYESIRAPAPTGSGNARASAQPGANFGLGDMDESIGYFEGERPPAVGRDY